MPKLSDTHARASNDGGTVFEHRHTTRVMSDGKFWIDVEDYLEDIKAIAKANPDRYKGVTFQYDTRVQYTCAVGNDLKVLQLLCYAHAEERVRSTVEETIYIYFDAGATYRMQTSPNGAVYGSREDVEDATIERVGSSRGFGTDKLELQVHVGLVLCKKLTTETGVVSRTVEHVRMAADDPRVGAQGVRLQNWGCNPHVSKWQHDRIASYLSPYTEAAAAEVNLAMETLLGGVHAASEMQTRLAALDPIVADD